MKPKTKRKITGILDSPITVRDVVVGLVVGLIAILTLGASTPPQFQARVASLKAEPIPAYQPIAPVVSTEVRQSATPVNKQPVASLSVAPTPQGGNGYIIPGSNCVVCVMQLTGRAQSGNAGTHRATSSTPSVGAIMIWRAGEQGAGGAGHVGVVKGINPDGTVNIAHCNWGGGQTRFRSTGKFY